MHLSHRYIAHSIAALGGAFALTLASAPANAANVTFALFSTGEQTVYSAAQTQFSSGVANNDTPWTIVLTPAGATSTTATTTNPNTAWIANNATSKWISDVTDSTAGTSAAGNFDFQTSFNIPANVLLSTVQIQFAFTSDNATTAINVNGRSTGITGAGGFNAFSATQTLNSSDAVFQTGNNTIDFVVNNASTTPNPMGLNVVFTSSSGATAPEPGSVALMLLGVTGLVARTRRRHTSAK